MVKDNYSTYKFKQLSEFLRKIKIPSRVILLTIGFLSTLWFLIRVIPKPSRAAYPCIKASAPFAATFITYVLGLGTFTFLMRKATQRLKRSKYLVAFVFIILGFVASTVTVVNNTSTIRAESLQGPQAVNEPMGVAKGTFPGRVVWVYEPDATNKDYSGSSLTYWYEDENTNQDEITKMLSRGLQKMTGTSTDADAWDAIFKYYNSNNGKGDVGYTPGEKIAIKINLNGLGNNNTSTPPRNINTSPQLCWALLNQLVNAAGVAQVNIGIGDSYRDMDDITYQKCHSDFPDIEYWGDNTGRTSIVRSSSKVVKYSDGVNEHYLPQQYLDAEYMINVPVFKKHHRSGISLAAKNHFGSIAPFHKGAWTLHPSLPCPDATGEAVNGDYGSYRCFVDLMGHKDLGGKTILYLIDGIWGSVNWGHPPVKFRMTPFNDDYPNSLFLSQDPVAIESVCYDFLYKEFDETHPTEGIFVGDDKGPFPQFAGTDDYLQQAADPANWPISIKYDPENDGSVLTSLGTHEHWNNHIDKLYTRNLEIENGIELVKVFPPARHITTDNSGLLSEQVNAVFIDSFNIKWFATPLGISRYDDENWDTISTDNYLLNNNVKDIAYERSGYGHEIWVATDGGLSVMMFNQIDGVTAATTYHTGDAVSQIINDTITAIGVDISHNRWVGTPAGLSVFKGSAWADTNRYMGENSHTIYEEWNDLTVNAMDSYMNDSSIFIATDRSGVLRYNYDELDGFTGASPYSSKYAGLPYAVNSITIHDTIQWFGTDEGAFRHLGNESRKNWTSYDTDAGLLSNNVTAVEVDDGGNIWMGTDAGLAVLTSAGFYTYTTDDGLIDSLINDIKKDYEDNIWLATNGGIEVLSDIPGSFTKAVQPVQSSDLVLDDIQFSEMTVSWKSGEGTNRVVFIKEGIDGTVEPVNNTTYTANAFPLGSSIGDWHCVYNGPGNSVTIGNLQQTTDYRVMVCEYGDFREYITYNTEAIYNNVATYTTLVEGIDPLLNNQILIYPTPFIDYLHITLNEVSDAAVARLFNMNGKLIRALHLVQEKNIINTSDILSGVYIMVITNGEKSYSYKLMK